MGLPLVYSTSVFREQYQHSLSSFVLLHYRLGLVRLCRGKCLLDDEVFIQWYWKTCIAGLFYSL